MDLKNKEIAKTFDAEQATYSKTVNEALSFSGLDVDFFTRVKADYILDIARSQFEDVRSLKLIDIGCGVGNFHPLLAPQLGKVTGVDISPASIERARSANPGVDYATYDGRRLPQDDSTFDIAIAVCVMHHVPPADWPNFASEMFRVLKPGGFAICFEHNPLNPVARRVVDRCPFDDDAVLLRSVETVNLLKLAGFDDAKARFILTVPAFNSALRSLDRLFSRVPLGAQYYAIARKN